MLPLCFREKMSVRESLVRFLETVIAIAARLSSSSSCRHIISSSAGLALLSWIRRHGRIGGGEIGYVWVEIKGRNSVDLRLIWSKWNILKFYRDRRQDVVQEIEGK